MQVLFTGGTGILGGATGRLLAARGHAVRLLDVAPEPSAAARAPGVEIVRGDVLSFGDLGDAMRGVDAVVHLAYSLGEASNRRPYAASTLNVQGTASVLEAARLFGVGRVVLASSVAVYGSDDMYAPAELPLTEDAATHLAPGMPLYGAGKLYLERLAEVYRKTYGLLGVGLRPSPVYGPGGVRGVSGWLAGVMAQAAAGGTVTVDRGDARISLVHVDDVAEQLVRLVGLDAAAFTDRYFFNTGGDATTMRELAALVAEIVPSARVEVTSAGETDVAGLVSRVSGRALADLIGYERRHDLRSGVRAHIEAIATTGA
ncbi:dihydroflavonol-4-reductase/UDP-glucose 4-epimerase [Actinomycetospora succinea]|uniref:Dihydroflavonol-4-reductase/UDP-glucose 4-epimerase n=1 Tax=Actinomycetospora succinea TaxID=663603 RepID=A0A4R6UY82_9PSEU|nr:NAD(P)-dependent oxidoreductase [Actinomycetospora succinea]TDQ50903.1 dihydroflavonol-4-reductase/UDP-glucose 4-epimerase [Actinomycetospora succinea]